MIEIKEVLRPTDNAGRGFINFPFILYAHSPCWVPPFRQGMRRIVSKRHPFFEHAEGAFFTAFDGGTVVGRIAIVENQLEDDEKDSRSGTFCFFDSVDSGPVAAALFDAAESWAKKRKIGLITGPRFSSGSYGVGVLVDGFEHRAAMTMSSYNYRYYGDLIEARGYEKRCDYLSAVIDTQSFGMPEKISRIADLTVKRGHFEVLKFSSKRELARISNAIGEMHNRTLGQFNGVNRLTDREVSEVKKDLLTVADPALIKILSYDGRIVGFLFTFHDLSAALQCNKGKITPLGIIRLVRESKKTKDLLVNGIGIIPEYQRRGGNALLYKELERTVRENVKGSQSCELVQIAETTWLMMRDLESLGAQVHKRHRLYEKRL